MEALRLPLAARNREPANSLEADEGSPFPVIVSQRR